MNSHNHFVFVALMGLLFSPVFPETCSSEIRLELDHASSQIDGLDDVALNERVLTAKAVDDVNAVVVVFSDSPLIVANTVNATAKLVPGWDGTLGYSRYALKISAREGSHLEVALQAVLPPASPLRQTADELSDFRQRFSVRPSCFPNDAVEFRQWQQLYRDKLVNRLMGGATPNRVKLDAQIVEILDYPTFTLRRVTYRTQAERTNELLLSLPKGVSENIPLLLALHGHEAPWGQADMKAYSPGHADDFIAYFAERGWAVLQPAMMNHKLQHDSWTLLGEWTWDAIVALDYAATLPEINADAAAVAGLSSGGHAAMNVLAADDRVRVGVVGGILSSWNHYSQRLRMPPGCDCGISRQLGPVFEQCDWAALAAPKPVQFQHGMKDLVFCPGTDEDELDLKWSIGRMPIAEFDTVYAEIERAYKLAGHPSHVTINYHKGSHKIENEAAWTWINRWVKDTQ